MFKPYQDYTLASGPQSKLSKHEWQSNQLYLIPLPLHSINNKKNIYFPIMTNTGQLKNVFTSYDSSTCHDFGPFMTSDVCLSVCPSVWLYLPHPRLTFEERTLFVIKNELKNCIFKKFSILRFQEDYLFSSVNIYRKNGSFVL
jgi:hypothetical protein